MERHLGFWESVRLGLYVSVPAAMVLVPAAVGFQTWLIPAVGFPLIMAGCVVGGWLVPRSFAATDAALVLAWFAGVAAAFGLIALGGYLIAAFEPHCVTTDRWVCFETVEEQRAANFRASLLPIAGGVILLAVLTVVGVRRGGDLYDDYFGPSGRFRR
ncbi:hypothetical protein LG943_04790 [Streptomonospora sp. S1-112]|uniref:Uncharacterized protein n=1 Tax=Streptomonospora mangrovi TaxID=2883123 RepID=A0A9X3SLS7_9ACTN|nr:hypothetical protein [Streptomonospora mangrovi]MDA0563651.1 hypothetical protein [Streptomonospora mangrovi]